jgi:SMC interacting uncharacterized protein involved in chromosome segregation
MDDKETLNAQISSLEKRFEEAELQAKARFDELIATLKANTAEILEAIASRSDVIEPVETRKLYIQ